MALDDEQLEFLHLYADQTEEVIRARWEAWANEGTTPDQEDQWTDTREGSFFWTATTGGIREDARIYDLMGSEVPASGHPLWAWESYLDDVAEVVKVFRLPATYADGEVTFEGTDGTDIPAGTTTEALAAEPGGDAPEFQVSTGGTIGDDAPGEVTLPVTATVAGEIGNVGPGAVSVLSTPITGVTVNNADPIEGGTETESDPALRARVLARYGGGSGAANVEWYEQRALEEPGVGRVTVIPLWDGPGTVKVVVTTADGDPVGAGVLASLQERLDPAAEPAEGQGEAPVGPEVTVETAAALAVVIAALIEFESGYSLDGTGGTVTLALRDLITDAIVRYIESVGPGEEIVLNQVIGRITSITGVHDVSGVTINGVAANVTVDDDPAQVPQVTTPLTLTEV